MKIKHIIYFVAAGCLLAASCSKGKEALPDSVTLVRSAKALEMEDRTDIRAEEYDAVVTVMQTEQQIIFFQVDSVSRLYPLNYEQPFTGPKRLACRVIDSLDDIVEGNKNYHLGWVIWSEEVVKGEVGIADAEIQPLPDDGLDILEDWMTTLEDGFLTLHYASFWGDGSVEHRMCLDKTGEAEFCLRYYRNGDENLHEGDALIYFDLNDCLPKTEGMDIKLKWTTGAGESAEKSFRFRSRP